MKDPILKRSKFIRLGLMGASVIVLAACGEDEPRVNGEIYQSVAECEAAVDADNAPKHTHDECLQQFNAAAKAHETEAPRYTAKALCEEEFGTGNCESRQVKNEDGSSFSDVFVPGMMGYMIGNAVSSMNNRGVGQTYESEDRDCDPRVRDCRSRGTGYVGTTGSRYYSTPLYRTYSDGSYSTFKTGAGADLGTNRTGAVTTGVSSFKASPGPTVVSRGGFGARAAGFAAS